jgi:anti-sigma B factor antagonist
MVQGDTFTASSESNDRTRWITLSGEFDMATAPSLHEELSRAANSPTPAVVLDLSALTFMDFIALRAVIDFAGRARARGWQRRIISPPPRVAKLFDLTGPGKTLPLRSAADDRRPGRSPRALQVAMG